MRQILPLIVLLASLFMAPFAMAQGSSDEHEARMALAQNMANMTISIITDQKKKSAAEREDVLINGFAKSVDIDWIARFVAGNAWRTATEKERERYTDLYRQYLTNVYVSTYAESPDRKIRDIKVIGINDSDADENRFLTRTEILLSNDQNVRVDYLAEARGDGYKIIDVVIEGVSLLSSHRSQFHPVATSRGMNGLIAALENLLDRDGGSTLAANGAPAVSSIN
jgi:phospholipid transport system substrate-binding protein